MRTIGAPAAKRLLPGLVLALTMCGASAASAEEVAPYISPLTEIPLTSPRWTGARAAGMGGAGLAAVEDASAISINPAALTRLRRIEVAGGFSRRVDDLTGDAFGRPFETSLSQTSLSSLRAAYPFPTFRGGLVFGLSVDRVQDFHDDFLAAYSNDIIWNEPVPGDTTFVEMQGEWDQVEDLITEGGIHAFTGAGAVDVSPNVSLGLAVSYWSGDFARRFSYRASDENELSDSYDRYFLDIVSESDVSGFGAKLGGLFYVTEGLSAALVVDLPMSLTFETTEDVRAKTDGPGGWLDESTGLYSEQVDLPLSIAGGVAYNPTDLVAIAADVRFTDWSEISNEGIIVLDEAAPGDDAPLTRQLAYEATTDLSLGVEVTVPSWPLRLRGGYTTRPIAYRGLEVEQDRSYFTLGAGFLIDTVLAIDVAWITGAYERSASDYDYSENVDEGALLLEAAYRF
jgi:long-subunit fatty acid transport protein